MTTETQRPQLGQVLDTLGSEEMRAEIQKLLPPDVTLDRFTQTTIVAIQHNPDVLNADRTSLYNAISRAAADGLLPDGKEGALVVFNQKFRENNREFSTKVVKWMPMVEGIIKQLGKANISAYAASVHENDKIEIWNDDKGQHVDHRPKAFSDRGAIIGVFACARVGDRTYVEALSNEEIEQIRKSSRSGDSGPWNVWYGRMAQKSALHRVKKRVPIADPRIAAALRDPEEDPDIVPISAVPALPVIPRDEVLQQQPPVERTVVEAQQQQAPPPKAETSQPSPRRPRGLQTVVERARQAPAEDRGDVF